MPSSPTGPGAGTSAAASRPWETCRGRISRTCSRTIPSRTGTRAPTCRAIASPASAPACTWGGRFFPLGGAFFHIGGIPIGYLAAVDATSGAVNTSWVTQPSSTVQALAVSGSTLYVGGSFVNILGDTTAKYVAALDTTGFGNFAGNWDPPIAHADGPVFALAVGASALYVGGHFTSAGGQSRIDVAALDADTGHALAGWNANVNGDVLALAVAGSRVYAGGMFSKVGAQFRDGFVSLDP